MRAFVTVKECTSSVAYTFIANAAEWSYDRGMKLLKDTRRSTRSNLKYHRPRSDGRHPKRRCLMNSLIASRRRPRLKSTCVLLAMFMQVEAMDHQTFATEIDRMTKEVTTLKSVYAGKKGQNNITRFDTDSFVLGFDNHASACISNDRQHFKDMREWKGSNLKGVGQTPIKGIGTLCWVLEDDNGRKVKLFIKDSLYVPTLSKCLLSPQHAAVSCSETDEQSTSMTTTATKSIFNFGKLGTNTLTIPHSKRTNVPEIRVQHGCKRYHSFASQVEGKTDVYQYETYCAPCALSTELEQDKAALVSDDEDDYDDSNEQTSRETATTVQASREKLTDMTTENIVDLLQPQEQEDIQTPTELPESQDVFAASDKGELLRYHYRLGHLPYSRLKTLAESGVIPRRLSKVTAPKCAACMFGRLTKRPWRARNQANKIFQATAPGQCVSADQMESTTAGFIAQMKGRITKRRYKYATIFTDHFSNYTYVHLQETLTSADTIKAKEAFEAHSRSLGVIIQHYHCDNGRFADNAFMNSVRTSKQTITFCGVNAHFQNGRAEKKIRDLRESGRTQLLHAMNRWPGVVTLNLWSYALRYANDVANTLQDKNGSSPFQRFAKVSVQSNLKDYHAFGCPVYALDSKLASGKRIGQWNPRCRIGLNLGFSPRHARTVTLVLNLQTATVSPQFHIKHDDFFESVSVGAGNMPQRSFWQSVAGFTPLAHPSALIPDKLAPLPNELNSHAQREKETELDLSAFEIVPPSINDESLDEQATSLITEDPTGDDTTLRRSTRQRLPPDRLTTSISGFPAINDEMDEEYYDALHQDDYKTQDEMTDPVAFLASSQKKNGDPDTLYYHQAMAAPDKEQFQTAMLKEYKDHGERGHWAIVALENIPLGTKILDAIWSMKRKRDIRTREILKHKARLTVHGGQQEHGVHYWETYAPVVNWFSVRLLLAQAIMHKWHTRQVDFVLAFPQAEPECDMYMKLPRGIEISGASNKTHALKLLKNLYGGKAASRIWVQYLSRGLRNMGFEPSAIDECVWYRGDIIFTFYVDDGIIWCPREEGIDEFLADIRNEEKTKQKFDIEDRGDISDYLGINLEIVDGKVKLSQPQLIEQIIKDVGVSNDRARPTPATSSKILHRDVKGEPFKGGFDYRSVVGKLNFLEKGSRPDIAYAVHQCARFSSAPTELHANAIRHIAKYLVGTRDKGILFNADMDKSLEVYVDADFSGNWCKETAEYDPGTAKSRSGYVITLHGCPLVWHSKLQTQVALSTTEAEYIALSQSMRDAIPIINIMKELKEKGFNDSKTTPRIHCKAFEDNSGALELANAPKMRPRTKHINLVYHHFRSFVRDKTVTVHAIGTLDQTGDVLTKPLDQNLFQKHRKVMMGW